MAYTQEKNGQGEDIVISGWERGIAPSPHRGIANIQNANIATETGEVMAGYGRVQNTMTTTSATGTLTTIDTSHVNLSIADTNNKFKGMWITVTNTSDAGQLNNGTYWVTLSLGGGFQLSATYGGATITGFTNVTATIALTRNFGRAVGYATETYRTASTQYYRYYILDHQGLVWVYDTVNDVFPSDDQQYWFLPNNSVTYFTGGTVPSGIAFLNGFIHVFSGATIYAKPSINLGANWAAVFNAAMMTYPLGNTPHFGYTGRQGRMYWTDGPYLGSIFPNSSIALGSSSSRPNIQSYCQYTASNTNGTISRVISGSLPNNGLPTSGGGVRIPAVFFTDAQGTQPTNLNAGEIYWIENNNGATGFQVFDADSGGAAIDLDDGATGNQYFNTYFPTSDEGSQSMVYTPQRLNLPIFEVSQCMTEVGNNLVVGTQSQTIYPWNQVSPTPSGIIFLPEANVVQLLTVNQIAYIFAGNKGNVYITDGSVASLVIKVPDYCAGVPGTQSSYFEPTFTWGGVAYVRGRVYFSILDQTSTKAGNCGGIWSFYPTQNLAYGQDTGLALRQENISSYATYSGYSTVIIPWFDQNIISPQFWSAWQSSTTSPTYGIDKTNTTPVGTMVVETDFLPVGTVLNKATNKQIEYRASAPLTSGESIAMYWRKNSTDAWTSAGSPIFPDGALGLAGYFQVNFQGSQWVQLRAQITLPASPSSSKFRLTQIRIR